MAVNSTSARFPEKGRDDGLPRGAVLKMRGPVSRTRGPVSRTRGPVSRTRGPVSRTRGPVSRTRGPVSRTRGPVSRTRGPVSRTHGPVSRTRRPVPRTRGPVPRTRGPVPRTRGPVSRTRGPVSKTRGGLASPSPRIALGPREDRMNPELRTGGPWDFLNSVAGYFITRRRRKRLPPLPAGTLALTVSSAPWVEVTCSVTSSALQLPTSSVSLHWT